ncbi:MAG: hypothetical protein ACR2PL_18185 [Dehalococcoidia bacterium]
MGLFLPLLAFALLDRDLLTPVSRKFLWAFMPVFVLGNIIAFQHIEWDNMKVFLYWYLATCIFVSALLVKTWRTQRTLLVRAVLCTAVLAMVLTGVLMHISDAAGRNTNMLLSRDDLRLAEEVRTKTPPHAIFVAGLQHDHPVSTMAGRRTVSYYWGWLYSWGINWQQRDRDVRAIYAFAPNAPDLLKKYHVDFVVIGGEERNELHARVDLFRARYPRIISTGNYEVFAVSDAARAAARG